MKNFPKRYLLRLLALLFAGVFSGAFGCATAQKPASAASARADEPGGAPQAPEDDAFEVARRWAAGVSGEPGGAPAPAPDPEVSSIIAPWQAAQVARIWAAGDEYRALITEKSTAAPGPAVLLYLVRDPRGAWIVQAVKPSTSTALWSQF